MRAAGSEEGRRARSNTSTHHFCVPGFTVFSSASRSLPHAEVQGPSTEKAANVATMNFILDGLRLVFASQNSLKLIEFFK